MGKVRLNQVQEWERVRLSRRGEVWTVVYKGEIASKRTGAMLGVSSGLKVIILENEESKQRKSFYESNWNTRVFRV